MMIKKYGRIIRIIAGLMVTCMTIVDAGLLINVTKNSSDGMTYLVEDYELESAYADGDFSGENSDNEERKEDFVEETKSKSVFNILEIVPNESMGVVGYAVAGCEPVTNTNDPLMREACMDALLNKAPGTNNANDQNLYMNTDIHQLSTKMQEGGVHSAFDFEAGRTYSGFYKYVGDGKGVYAIGLKDDNSYEIDKADKSAVMVSKFYPTAHKNTGRFDYIWEYTDDSVSNTTTDDYKFIYVKNHKRLKYINNDKFLRDSYGLSSDADLDAWKEDHQVVVKTKSPKTVSLDNIEWADLIVINSGNNMDYYQSAVNLYNKAFNKSYGKENFSKDIDFPSFEYVIRIYERVVIRKDVAIISSRNCVNGNVFDTNLRKLMCMLYYVNKGSSGGGSGREIFMDFIKRYVDEPGSYTTRDPEDGLTKSYYEIRQKDSRFIAPSLRGKDSGYMHQTHPLVRTNDDAIASSYFDEGTHNLVAVKGVSGTKNRRTAKRNDEDMYRWEGDAKGLDRGASYDQKEKYGEHVKEYYYSPLDYDKNGNLIPFGVTDIIPNSASEREIYEMTSLKEEYADYRWRMPLYESKSSTTDYIYIDDNGNFVRDDKYSGMWYGIDALTNNGDCWEYKIVTWNKMNESTWPWNVVEGGCLKEWWFGDGSTQVPGNSRGKHIHLYYDYYAYGGYRAITTAEATSYENQGMEEENALFKGDLIKDAVEKRPVKREDDDPGHVAESDAKDKTYYCLAMNILNGDGYNKTTTSKDKNKVLYINSYEMDAAKTPYIPIKFRVRTSSDLVKLELFKKEGTNLTLLKTYTPDSSNDIEESDTSIPLKFNGGAQTLTLTRIRDDDEDGNPKAYTGPVDSHTYVYTFEGTIERDLVYNYYKKGTNNRFVLRATIKPVDSKPVVVSEDNITIAVRDFFELN